MCENHPSYGEPSTTRTYRLLRLLRTLLGVAIAAATLARLLGVL